MGTMVTTYRDAGVDVEKGDHFVEWIESKVRQTYCDRVVSGVGGFASLYDMGDGRYLASGTDGVGTKLLLARRIGVHDTIGIDLVAMCVNDVICTGAKPLFFLDYLASASLDLEVSKAILNGITHGCLQASMALIGGETAEMPGMYSAGDYDLAGFCVGEVRKEDLLGGSRVVPGDTLVAVASSGFHSNGYSLLRRLLRDSDFKAGGFADQLLTPTKIYVDAVKALHKSLGPSLHGLSHITGSGLQNIPRMNDALHYRIDRIPESSEVPGCMGEFFERSGLEISELCNTFNMGMGLVIATDRPAEAMLALGNAGEKSWIIGGVEGPAIDRDVPGGLEGQVNKTLTFAFKFIS